MSCGTVVDYLSWCYSGEFTYNEQGDKIPFRYYRSEPGAQDFRGTNVYRSWHNMSDTEKMLLSTGDLYENVEFNEGAPPAAPQRQTNRDLAPIQYQCQATTQTNIPLVDIVSKQCGLGNS